MSVLRIAKANGTPEKIIKAKESRPFRIYKKSFGKGDIDIELTLPKANPSTSFTSSNMFSVSTKFSILLISFLISHFLVSHKRFFSSFSLNFKLSEF